MSTVLSSQNGVTVELTADGLIRKYGYRVAEVEALSMAFVAAHTTIPLPTVLSLSAIEVVLGDGKREDGHEIIMARVLGKTLEEAWPGLDESQRQTVVSEIGEYVSQLSSISSDFIGSIDKHPCREVAMPKRPQTVLPSVAAFHDHLIQQMSQAVPTEYKKFLRRTLRDDYKIVFAHADLSVKNILVHEGHVSAILDWDTAGFYPEYWEYVKTLWQTDWASGWPSLVAELYPERYDTEFFLFESVMQYTYL